MSDGGMQMSKKQKLIARLKSKPTDFTFEEIETLLMSIGFTKSNKGKTSGSRVKYQYENIPIDLHKPHPSSVLKPYAINDILNILESEGLI